MTVDQFQNKFHNYQTMSKSDAELEALKINKEADCFRVQVLTLPKMGYCLVLDTVKDFLKEILPEVN